VEPSGLGSSQFLNRKTRVSAEPSSWITTAFAATQLRLLLKSSHAPSFCGAWARRVAVVLVEMLLQAPHHVRLCLMAPNASMVHYPLATIS
jgi:hypothetical protein